MDKNMPNILLIEDDPDDQMVFLEVMGQLCGPSNCSIANNGAEALDILNMSENAFDIIFCDLNMPVMNGYGFLKAIAITEICSNVPVIILSTSCNNAEAERCRSMGATMFLTKPPNISTYCFKLGEALKAIPFIRKGFFED